MNRADEGVDSSVSILGVRVDRHTATSAMRRFEEYIATGRPHRVFLVNAHTLNLAFEDSAYREILNSADLVLNDGTGVNWAAKCLDGRPFEENLVGTDLIPRFCAIAGERGYALYLLGGEPGIAERAAASLKRLTPGLKIAGFHHGYFAEEETNKVISSINALAPQVLLVSFGNPRQEQWIHHHGSRLAPPLCIGVGGLFDHLSGELIRAPRWIRALGIEWTFILLFQPHKWKRYLIGNPQFVLRVLNWKRRRFGNPRLC